MKWRSKRSDCFHCKRTIQSKTILIAKALAIFLGCLDGVHCFVIQRNTMASTTIAPISYASSTATSFHLKLVPTDSTSEDSDESERRNGILVLMTVPMAWGTFEPAVRYVYKIQPSIPPFVFSFAYYLIATAALGSLALLSTHTEGEKLELPEEGYVESTADGSSTQKSDNLVPVVGGLELGTYLFLGNGLQVIGLKTVPSDRAAFLLQLTTIFVPIVQSIIAKNVSAVPTKTWIACFVALAGVGCIGLDSGGQESLTELSLNSIQFSIGDLYVALGAVFYTFHCIRLELYAKSTAAVRLAAAKASTEALWCAIFISSSVLLAGSDSTHSLPVLDAVRTSGINVIDYLESLNLSLRDHTIAPTQWFELVAATSWTGLVTIAYTIYAQSYGQARVVPATANLIYTTQPFITALIAYIVLGESLGVSGYVGGLLIAAAVLLVIQRDPSQSRVN